MAIVLPLLLLIVFGIIEFGIGFNRQLQVTEAAHEGARVAALGGSRAAVEDKVRQVLGDRGDTELSFPTLETCADDATAGDATVGVSLYYWSPTGLGALMSHFGSRDITSFEIRATGVMSCVG
jgi:hypothetical protein